MNKKICILVSNFYPKISKELITGAENYLKQNEIKNYKILNVPGTFEIPIVLSKLIKMYDGFIVLGCVIRGQTSHFDFLCQSVFNSILSLSTKHNVPVSNGILTCENKKQADKRANHKKGDKGGDAAKALISVLKIIS
tara:strand:- start:7429 stop:7842 length:414 start_codon:yes stop_codon:yes gene_type:complete